MSSICPSPSGTDHIRQWTDPLPGSQTRIPARFTLPTVKNVLLIHNKRQTRRNGTMKWDGTTVHSCTRRSFASKFCILATFTWTESYNENTSPGNITIRSLITSIKTSESDLHTVVARRLKCLHFEYQKGHDCVRAISLQGALEIWGHKIKKMYVVNV